MFRHQQYRIEATNDDGLTFALHDTDDAADIPQIVEAMKEEADDLGSPCTIAVYQLQRTIRHAQEPNH